MNKGGAARLKEEDLDEEDNNGDEKQPKEKKAKTNNNDDALIQSLMERVGASASKVDPIWLNHLLDASSGNLDLAASYFWDNYVLQKQAQEEEEAKEEEEPNKSSRKRKKTIKKRIKQEPKDDNDNDVPVRQRLERRLASAARNNPKYDGDDDQDEEKEHDDEDDDVIVNNNNNHRVAHRRRQHHANIHLRNDDNNDNDDIILRNDNEEDDDDDNEIHGEIANDHNNRHDNRNDNNIQHEISASVSDDEGGIWRITRMERSYTSLKPPGPPLQPKAPKEEGKKSDDEDDNKDAPNDADQNDYNNLYEDSELYLSDDDWLLKPSSYTEHSDNKNPLDILWGSSTPVTKVSSSSSDSRNNNDSNNSNQEGEGEENKEEGPSNVLDDDDDDDENSNSRHQEDDEDHASSRIPSTWLNAGFFMCPDEGNLLLKPPSDEDFALHRWRQSQQSSSSSNQSQLVLPPHYCKSVTALLSVVQATMISGTSIQGGTVLDSNTVQTPWEELSTAERKKQFDKRLVQALSALLFLAWKTAKARKEKALEIKKTKKRKQCLISNIPDGDCHLWGSPTTRGVFQKRLEQLCPTCNWEVDSTTGESRLPENRSSREVIMTSFTNIHDISSYVGSNLRTFMAKGGCVLFLETLIRIHGAKTIARQMKDQNEGKENKNDQQSSSFKSCLIHCTCEARQIKPTKTSSYNTTTGNSSSNNKNIVLDTTPPGHDCISVELLSLVLTGEIRSSWNKDWSVDPSLGFGLLSRNHKEHVLSSPSYSLSNKPKVWILRGDTCHSVAWINASNTYGTNDSDVMKLSHWNHWFGLSHNLTHFRLVKGREPWKPPVLSKFVSSSSQQKNKKKRTTVVDRIWQQRQRQKEAERKLQSTGDSTSKEEDSSDDDTDKNNSKATILIHPEDKSFYPDNYRRWRYQFPNTTTSSTDDNWISFATLTSSQRDMVEWQMAPPIHFVFWNSGYKNAILDQFHPAPPVV